MAAVCSSKMLVHTSPCMITAQKTNIDIVTVKTWSLIDVKLFLIYVVLIDVQLPSSSYKTSQLSVGDFPSYSWSSKFESWPTGCLYWLRFFIVLLGFSGRLLRKHFKISQHYFFFILIISSFIVILPLHCVICSSWINHSIIIVVITGHHIWVIITSAPYLERLHIWSFDSATGYADWGFSRFFFQLFQKNVGILGTLK